MKTRVTAALGIRYPIIQGGMQWVGKAELVSAECMVIDAARKRDEGRNMVREARG
jgi:hypothetical protein